jgi:hypothetical protein
VILRAIFILNEGLCFPSLPSFYCPVSIFRLAIAFKISSYPVQTIAAEMTFLANRGDIPLKNP